jgi:hypothetical protein
MSEDCHSSDNIRLPRPTADELVQERLERNYAIAPKRFVGMMKVVVVRKGDRWYAFDPCDTDATQLFIRLPADTYDLEIKLMPVEQYRSMPAVCDPIKHLTG